MNHEREIIYSEPGVTPEEEKRRWEVIQRLQGRMFSHDPLEFYESLIRSHHLRMLTLYSVEEFRTMQVYKVLGYYVGFALKNVGENREIVSVHNNEPFIHALGTHIVAAAIKEGGNALDHFGSEKLNLLYEGMGLVEIGREAYDPRYDPDGSFRNRYGELPIIYRILK